MIFYMTKIARMRLWISAVMYAQGSAMPTEKREPATAKAKACVLRV